MCPRLVSAQPVGDQEELWPETEKDLPCISERNLDPQENIIILYFFMFLYQRGFGVLGFWGFDLGILILVAIALFFSILF